MPLRWSLSCRPEKYQQEATCPLQAGQDALQIANSNNIRLSKKLQNVDFLKLNIFSPTPGTLTYWTA